jgi:1-acyl-sn-glycerol-3-phosphate acyltransferase
MTAAAAPDFELRRRAESVAAWLFENYWRVTTEGAARIPREGPFLMVGNHSGTLPLDAAMLVHAVARECGRELRPLYHRWIDGHPVAARLLRSLGGVTASYDAASRLLAAGEAVLLFPEGVEGVAKPFCERYRLRPFATSAGRLAQEHRVPVVPFALVGAEESSPLLGRSPALGEALGLPYLPLTAGGTLAGPLGLLPLPTKWSLRFGHPLYLHREHRFRSPGCDPEAMAERLRQAVAGQLARELGRRRSLFLG